MSDRSEEKRARQRIPVRLPVSIKSAQGAEDSAQTRDLSSGGVFFYTASKFAEGTDLEMVLVLPSELTFGERRWVCCQASVVRVENSPELGNFGVAARIERFQILPEI
ncbi:MAG: hypothetical protein DMG68_15260 [Acidobacteria bacterium]|jgi:hypothetical protein|nr:MAG: hypothetical protein DMG68_15260 [Acidobacteriota bacterium]